MGVKNSATIIVSRAWSLLGQHLRMMRRRDDVVGPYTIASSLPTVATQSRILLPQHLATCVVAYPQDILPGLDSPVDTCSCTMYS